jgi:hypothetical protein
MRLIVPADRVMLTSMDMSNCIALGVGVGKLEEAASFYESMGMKRAKVDNNWIEVQSGPLRLFLVGDEHGTPTFDIQVDDVSKAMEQFLASGCEEIQMDNSPDERFIRTPYGHFFCVSPRS